MTHAPDLLSSLYVFLLATFVGLEVIKRVSPLLHTPLMSLTNAISAIAVVASIVIAGQDHPPVITLLGAIALDLGGHHAAKPRRKRCASTD